MESQLGLDNEDISAANSLLTLAFSNRPVMSPYKVEMTSGAPCDVPSTSSSSTDVTVKNHPPPPTLLSSSSSSSSSSSTTSSTAMHPITGVEPQSVPSETSSSSESVVSNPHPQAPIAPEITKSCVPSTSHRVAPEASASPARHSSQSHVMASPSHRSAGHSITPNHRNSAMPPPPPPPPAPSLMRSASSSPITPVPGSSPTSHPRLYTEMQTYSRPLLGTPSPSTPSSLSSISHQPATTSHVFTTPLPVPSTIPVTLNAMIPIVTGPQSSQASANGHLSLTQRLLTAPKDPIERTVSSLCTTVSTPSPQATARKRPNQTPAEKKPAPKRARRRRGAANADDAEASTSAEATSDASRPGSEDQESQLKPKKKAYVPSYVQEGEKCVVCGDNSTGTHYRAMTCEGCKGFFRRTIQSRAYLKFACKKNGSCEIGPQTRNACQFCRYQLCIQNKMDPESVLSDPERLNLRSLIETNRAERQKRLSQILSKEEAEILLQIGDAFKTKDVSRFYVFTDDMQEPDNKLTPATPAISPSVQHAIRFIKAIPGVDKIPDTDLITLMHQHLIDVIGLRIAEIYDKAKKALVFSNKLFVASDLQQFPWMERIFKFAQCYADFVTSDGAIIGCLCAIRFLSTDNLKVVNEPVIDTTLDTINQILVKYLQQERVAGVHHLFTGLANFENIRQNDGVILSRLAMMDNYGPAITALTVSSAAPNVQSSASSSPLRPTQISDPEFLTAQNISATTSTPKPSPKNSTRANGKLTSAPAHSPAVFSPLDTASRRNPAESFTRPVNGNGSHPVIEENPWITLKLPNSKPPPKAVDFTTETANKDMAKTMSWLTAPAVKGLPNRVAAPGLIPNGTHSSASLSAIPGKTLKAEMAHHDDRQELQANAVDKTLSKENPNGQTGHGNGDCVGTPIINNGHSQSVIGNGKGDNARNCSRTVLETRTLSSMTNGDHNVLRPQEEEKIGQPKVALEFGGAIPKVLAQNPSGTSRRSQATKTSRGRRGRGVRTNGKVNEGSCGSSKTRDSNGQASHGPTYDEDDPIFKNLPALVEMSNGHHVPPESARLFSLPTADPIPPTHTQSYQSTDFSNGVPHHARDPRMIQDSPQHLERNYVNVAPGVVTSPTAVNEVTVTGTFEEESPEVQNAIRDLLRRSVSLERQVQELSRSRSAPTTAEVEQVRLKQEQYRHDVEWFLLRRNDNLDLAKSSLFVSDLNQPLDVYHPTVRAPPHPIASNNNDNILTARPRAVNENRPVVDNSTHNIYPAHPSPNVPLNLHRAIGHEDAINTVRPTHDHMPCPYPGHSAPNNSIIRALQGPPQFRSINDDGRQVISAPRNTDMRHHPPATSMQQELDAATTLSSFGRGSDVASYSGVNLRREAPHCYDEQAQDLTIGPKRARQTQETFADSDVCFHQSPSRSSHPSAMPEHLEDIDYPHPYPHRRTSSFSGVLQASPLKRRRSGPPSLPFVFGTSSPAHTDSSTHHYSHPSNHHHHQLYPHTQHHRAYSPHSLSAEDTMSNPASTTASPESVRRGSFSSSTPSPSGNGTTSGYRSLKKRWLTRHTTSFHGDPDSNGS